MRIAIIHGYLLNDSGSAVYVRELTRQMVRLGHDVTLICQEQNPQNHDFINSFYRFDDKNSEMQKIYDRKSNYAGNCRLVVPNIRGSLLIYFPGPFPGFETATFQESPMPLINSYIEANIKAITKVFEIWPPDLVQANHMLMQPYIVNKSLKSNCPYIVTIHGSALNFTVKKDRRMLPYAIEGLNDASAIITSSKTSLNQVKNFVNQNRLNVNEKLHVIAPGVDTTIFKPPRDFIKAREALGLDEKDDVLVFTGRLLWTKGLHYLLAALPLILKKRPRAQLLIAGEGPMENLLKQLVDAFNIKNRVRFMGHLDHKHLSRLLGIADLAVAPSVIPEAFGLVFIEALASGSLPVATYSGGFRSILDSIREELPDPAFRTLTPISQLTGEMADLIVNLLNVYPTKDTNFRQKLHKIAQKKFSWEQTAYAYLKLN